MYSKEVVKAICANHVYEYCIVSKQYEVLKHSEKVSKYCDNEMLTLDTIDIFELIPEFIGMETDLASIFDGTQEELVIPMVFKEPQDYINIHVQLNRAFGTLIVLFENITDGTVTQYHLRQANNNNLLLLEEVAQKNKQLEVFNEKMQKLVEEEVSKNLEKQHMLELQTRHAQMGEMISLITHQWKQPLSVIQTLGTLLKMKYDLQTLTPELTVEKIENILQQVDYMTQTVNDFQKFFTPSKERTMFNVKKTIYSVLELVKMDYALSNIAVSIAGGDEVRVKGYANEYKQVILSLLQNAKDAFEGEDISNKHVHINVTQEKEHSLVSISDNAGGIPKEMIAEVFTQYMTSKINGSGLGLYIAKSVIENNMQGKIWVENTKDGAVFFIKV